MWQTDLADPPRRSKNGASPEACLLPPAAVASVYLLHWNEHCMECALPDCFKVCPLYVQRRDRKCARFKNGIVPNPRFPGLFPYGAEIQFRRWGKLESNFGFGAVRPEQARRLDRVDHTFLQGIGNASHWLRRVSPHYRLSGAYAVYRERLLQAMTRRRKDEFEEFVAEVWNLQPHPVRLVIECWQGGPTFRTSLLLPPGRTLHRILFAAMNVDLFGPFGMVRVYPENDAEAHLVFSWLDFVRYAAPETRPATPIRSGPGTAAARPADQIKCVIWDLDGTVWDGVLGEQDAEKIALRPQVRRTMMALDEKGILQSVASKNDYHLAWSALHRLGVAHLFLNPEINWQPKSANIRHIVKALNIGADACGFIDDSAFERAEVSRHFPEMRTYCDADVAALLERPEFEVRPTLESRQRRLSYLAESERKQQARSCGDDYDTFLKTCKMQATLFTPTEPEHRERCLELLHRSNQLNLSTHRYTAEEFHRLLGEEGAVCLCVSCQDRFGDYGIVGFASLRRLPDHLLLVDFVMSCRVAGKKLENAWFNWLMETARPAGYEEIYASYVKTSRNGVLLSALLEVGFVEIEKRPEGLHLRLDCKGTPPASGIVSITARGIAEFPLARTGVARSLAQKAG